MGGFLEIAVGGRGSPGSAPRWRKSPIPASPTRAAITGPPAWNAWTSGMPSAVSGGCGCPSRTACGGGDGSRRPTFHSVDDYTRLAYSEPLSDEKASTVVGFTIRALEFYWECGITHVEEVMTDNHWSYTHSLGFKALLRGRGIKHLTIKPGSSPFSVGVGFWSVFMVRLAGGLGWRSFGGW